MTVEAAPMLAPVSRAVVNAGGFPPSVLSRGGNSAVGFVVILGSFLSCLHTNRSTPLPAFSRSFSTFHFEIIEFQL